MTVSLVIENGESTVWLFTDFPRETEDLLERICTEHLTDILGLPFLQLDHIVVNGSFGHNLDGFHNARLSDAVQSTVSLADPTLAC